MQRDRAIDVDVLVVGGSIQGLMILEQCLKAGWRSVLLVTRDELGAGETLHSHGYDLRGYPVPSQGEHFVRPFAEGSAWWHEWVCERSLDRPVAHATYFGIADEDAAERTALWQRQGLPWEQCEMLPPALEGGSCAVDGTRLFRTENRLLRPWEIVEAASRPLQSHIVQGELEAISYGEETNSIETCSVRLGEHGIRTISPQVLVLATGRDTQRLLKGIESEPTGWWSRLLRRRSRPFASQASQLHQVRYVPMLLVKGELPAITGTFERVPLILVTHEQEDGAAMWVVTIMGNHETTREDIDSREEPAVDPSVVQRTIAGLCALIPGLERRLESLAFSMYMGAKIDHPEGKPASFIGDLGINNLRFAWPVFWTMAGTTAERLVRELREASLSDGFAASDLFDARRHGLSVGVQVGEEKRLAGTQRWQSWDDFRGAYRIPPPPRPAVTGDAPTAGDQRSQSKALADPAESSQDSSS